MSIGSLRKPQLQRQRKCCEMLLLKDLPQNCWLCDSRIKQHCKQRNLFNFLFSAGWPRISVAFSQTRAWLQLLERQSSKDYLDSSATTPITCPCMRRTSLNSDIQKFPIKYSDYVAETWRELFQFSTATVMRGLRRANIGTWPLWTGHQSKGKLRFYYRWR